MSAPSGTFSALLLIASACLAMLRLPPASLARLYDECFAVTTHCELFQKGPSIRLPRRSSASKTHEPKGLELRAAIGRKVPASTLIERFGVCRLNLQV